ncbi:MAG: hypothetical protein AAF465_14490 [Pseudomonadota bacterium]
MRPIKLLAIVLLIPFSVLSVYAVQQVGYFGIFDYHRHSPAGWQVFSDLVIAILLIMVWMIRDARKTNRTVWPFILASLTLGSIGPLLYLALGPNAKSSVVTA